MSRRSLAFLLTGLCAVAAIGLVGATASFATNQAAPHQPTLTPQNSGTTQGLIAVSPVNKHVVWASGRGGTFAVTTDGGATWRAGVVPGAEALQFRDVEGVSDKVAYLMSIGNDPAISGSTRQRTAVRPGRSSSRTRILPRSTTASPSGRPSGALPRATL